MAANQKPDVDGKDKTAGDLYRMKIYASFEDNSPEAARWLQECFSRVFHKHATELELRGGIQFEELYYRNYTKICVEGSHEKLAKMREVIKKFQDNQPIYRFDRAEFSQPCPIQYYHYHKVTDKYAEWYGKKDDN